jgi:hypothetical protein
VEVAALCTRSSEQATKTAPIATETAWSEVSGSPRACPTPQKPHLVEFVASGRPLLAKESGAGGATGRRKVVGCGQAGTGPQGAGR